MILIIDNYDSFVFNLARYTQELGREYKMFRNDQISISEIKLINPSHIILSPGPCTPNEAGISNQVIEDLYTSFPILGICLGHQCIGQAFGGNIIKANKPIHGKTSQIDHNGFGIFEDIPNNFSATRYHSLIIEEDSLPSQLTITSKAAGGEIMSVKHNRYPTIGLQFHPESVLTEHGHKLINNFLQLSVT
jgi:para-aminobenzoate synthetase component II